jgi:hypothetical protein
MVDAGNMIYQATGHSMFQFFSSRPTAIMLTHSDTVKKAISGLSNYVSAKKDEWRECSAMPSLNSFFIKKQNELKRLERAFNTRRFVVVTIGALKAGKSTLINAMTGCNVSPAGTGAETTKKCSIILAADEEHPEGITLYRYMNTVASADTSPEEHLNKCKENTQTLMDYFKGVCEWNENEFRDFDKKAYPLRGSDLDPKNIMDNLEYIL